MSMELMVKAMKTKVGNPLRKLVLLKLADNANDKGECWPSYQHVADQCEIARSSVKSHVRALEGMGLLRREFRKNGELNQSNLFYLTLDNPAANASPEGGSGAALGQEITQVGQEMTGGGAGAALGGGAGAAPRISHSFEPVKEPVKEPISIGAQADACTPKKVSGQGYSVEFEQAWSAYPKRAGGNSKQSAWKAWNARIREGVSAAEMIAGVQRYAGFVLATGNTGTQFVKQASTFFGPDRHFEESWDAPSAKVNQTPAQSKHCGFAERDYGTTQMPSWAREAKQ